MMPEDEKTITIARRTRKNLLFIQCAKKRGEDVEEVTQVINSMLGMLICLREEYLREKSVTWDDLKNHSLESISIEAKRRENKTDPWENYQPSFSQLISKLRHGFAHNSFELIGGRQPCGKNEISKIRVWNIPHGKTYKTWEVIVTIEKLKSIAFLFIDYLEKL